jgi:hypothetical protein
MIRKYQTIPEEVEAVQYLGSNKDEVLKFCSQVEDYLPLKINDMEVVQGEYIVKDSSGVLHLMSEELFKETYTDVKGQPDETMVDWFSLLRKK